MSALSATFSRPASGADRRDVLRALAKPATQADRWRARLISLGVAGSGSFALAAIAIATINGDQNSSPRAALQLRHLAPYIAQSGLRGGTALGASLLVIPFVLFGIQALRTGTAARERRLAALSLAGATSRQLRRLAYLEGTRAAAIGALLAGPGYLLLWLVFGVAAPDGWKMLPEPGLALAIGWPVLVVLLTVAGGWAGRMAATPAMVSPLGMTRRQPGELQQGNAVVPIAALLFVALGWFWAVESGGNGPGQGLVVLGAIVFAVTTGPWVILITGRRAVGRGLVTTMAGRRLLADVRSPGRVVGVLLTAGVAFGVIAAELADLLTGPWFFGDDAGFYLGGYLAAAMAALLACVVASSSLIVAATEQVLDGRRANAVLVALAASPWFIVRVVRRQLLLAAVPAAVLGAALGWLFGAVLLVGVSNDGVAWLALAIALPSALAVSALAAGLGAWVAARAVQPAILASSSADNLRAP